MGRGFAPIQPFRGHQELPAGRGVIHLEEGSLWNTMPAHTRAHRCETYIYFNVAEGHQVVHLMGEPTETRHIMVSNRQAVISPS